ncbi:MAG: hypothetical protein LJE67_10125 [Salaquimonas sp.]|jgi:hypothetical protein|nr:hypothetical protein [Salaquimonas sp.]
MTAKAITSTIAAAMIALATLSASPALAAGPQGPHGLTQPNVSGHQRWPDNGHRRHDRVRYGWGRHNACSPREAVYKARRMGLRHANVARIDRRAIVVTGHSWGRYGGHRARVVFARYSRHCAILGQRGL